MRLSRLLRPPAALALVAAVVAAAPAAAQEITFAGARWDAPADSFRARLDAAGFRHVRTYENGDLRFRSEQGEVAMAMVRGGRVVALQVWRPSPADSLDLRLEAVGDSLRRVYGPPVLEDDSVAGWVRGATLLTVSREPARGQQPPAVTLFFKGPGYGDELADRGAAGETEFPALGEEWTVLGVGPTVRVSVDTASIERRGPNVYRARTRIDRAEPVPDPSGRYDALVYGADYDCAGRRVQLRSRTALLGGRQVRSDAGATVWVPAGPQYAMHLELVCRYARQRPGS